MRGFIALILVLGVVSVSGCMVAYTEPYYEGDFLAGGGRQMFGCGDVDRSELREGVKEDEVNGEMGIWTNVKTGREYQVITYLFWKGERVCEKKYDRYESEDCEQYKHEYNGSEILEGVDGNDVYFFWVADQFSMRIVEKEGYEGGPEREAVEESFARTKTLIDHYLPHNPSLEKCE